MNPLLLPIVAACLVGGSTLLFFRAAFSLRLQRDRTPYVVAWVVGALLGLVALSQGGGWLPGLLAGLATLVGSLFTVLVGISAQQVAADAITVGAPLPAFSAADEHGGTFSSASLEGKPVLMKFFRGHW